MKGYLPDLNLNSIWRVNLQFSFFMETCQIMSLRLYMLLYSDGFTYAVCVKMFSGLFFFFFGTKSIAKIFRLVSFSRDYLKKHSCRDDGFSAQICNCLLHHLPSQLMVLLPISLNY
jgi:hypothetical protein